MTHEAGGSSVDPIGAGEVAPENLGALVGRIARMISSERFPAADRAALRRHGPGNPPPLAFYRLWLRQMDSALPAENQTSAWALIVWGLALSGQNSHRPDRPLGKALVESGYSEARLERLLSADAATQHALFASLIRFMNSKGEGFDWKDAARLLLVVNDDKREAIHRAIASAYYRQQAQANRE